MEEWEKAAFDAMEALDRAEQSPIVRLWRAIDEAQRDAVGAPAGDWFHVVQPSGSILSRRKA